MSALSTGTAAAGAAVSAGGGALPRGPASAGGAVSVGGIVPEVPASAERGSLAGGTALVLLSGDPPVLASASVLIDQFLDLEIRSHSILLIQPNRQRFALQATGFLDCEDVMTVPSSTSVSDPPPDFSDALELGRIRLERERIALERARFESQQLESEAAPKQGPSKGKHAQRSKAQRLKPKRQRTVARAPQKSHAPVIGGVALLAACVGALVVATSSNQPKQAETVEIADAPSVSTGPDAKPPATEAPSSVAPPSPSSEAAEATTGVPRNAKASLETEDVVRRASAHEEAGEFGASYALLDGWLREHPESPDVAQARKQLLLYCKTLIESETTRAADLQRTGEGEQAIRMLEELAGRLPPPLARELRRVIRRIEVTPSDEARVTAQPTKGEDPAPGKSPGEPAPGVDAEPSISEPTERKIPESEHWFDDHASPVGFVEAPYYKSKYYLIKSNTKKKYTKRYAKMLDRYFKRYRAVFEDLLPSKRYEKSEIWIYATQREFMVAEDASEGTGGYYQPRTKRVVTFHGRFGETGTTRTVLAHEATHQFEDLVLEGKLSYAPIWIIEGLAVLFESAKYDGRKVHIGRVPRDRLASLKRGLKAGNLIPLRQLIRTPQRQFSGYHYAHAWGLIYRVLFSSEDSKVRRRNQRWFSDLFAAALNGPVTDRDVVEAMGGATAFAEFEETWKVWIRDLPYDFEPKNR